MALYALEDVDDAFAATRNFLTPVDRTVWVKLAVIVFFIGFPGVNGNSAQFSFGGDTNGSMGPGQPFQDPGGGFWLVVAAVALLAVLVVLAFAFVGSVMEFVFVESLRHEAVSIRYDWSRHWRRGLRLFGFRLVLGLIVVGSVLVLALPFILAGVADGGPMGGGLAIGAFLLLLPLFIVLALAVGLVDGFTTAFVVPIMLLEERNVLPAWGRLWGSIRESWAQYLAYAVAGLVLSFVGGMVVAICTGVVALVLLIPFGLLAAVGVGLFVLFAPAGIAVLVVVGLLFGLAVVAAAALLQVPVQTYLRYYALFVLGDIEPEFDAVPDQRAAVRADGGEDEDNDGGFDGGNGDDGTDDEGDDTGGFGDDGADGGDDDDDDDTDGGFGGRATPV